MKFLWSRTQKNFDTQTETTVCAYCLNKIYKGFWQKLLEARFNFGNEKAYTITSQRRLRLFGHVFMLTILKKSL